MFNPNFSINYSRLKTALATLKDFCVKKSTAIQFLLVRVRTITNAVEFYATTPDKEQITLTVTATIHNPLSKDISIYTQDLIRTFDKGTKTDEIEFAVTPDGLTMNYHLPRLAISGAIHCEECQEAYNLFTNVKSIGSSVPVTFKAGTLSKALDSLPDLIGTRPNLDRVIFDSLAGRVAAISTDGKTLTAVISETDSMEDGKAIEPVMEIFNYRPTASDKILKAICTLQKKDTIRIYFTHAQDDTQDLVSLYCTSANGISARFEMQRKSGIDVRPVWPRQDSTQICIRLSVSAFLEKLDHVCTQVPKGYGVWLEVNPTTARFIARYKDNKKAYSVNAQFTVLDQDCLQDDGYTICIDPRLLQRFLKGLPRVDTVNLNLPAWKAAPILCECVSQNLKALIMPMRTGEGDKTYKEEVEGA